MAAASTLPVALYLSFQSAAAAATTTTTTTTPLPSPPHPPPHFTPLTPHPYSISGDTIQIDLLQFTVARRVCKVRVWKSSRRFELGKVSTESLNLLPIRFNMSNALIFASQHQNQCYFGFIFTTASDPKGLCRTQFHIQMSYVGHHFRSLSNVQSDVEDFSKMILSIQEKFG